MWINKNKYKLKITDYHRRIDQLEQIICPDEHDWVVVSEFTDKSVGLMCKRCKKIIIDDYYYDEES